MVSFIKKILFPHKYLFKRICKANSLCLDFNINKSELYVLKEIFEDRTYSDYFPFYENVTVVDIGGHYGYFSLFASLNLHPQSKIFCFEPAKRNFEVLNLNLKNKKERINVKSLQTVLLENNIQTIDFLKMDCEGAEYEILNLLGKEIFNYIKVISLEFHDLKNEKFTGNFLVKHLEGLGFEIKLFNYSKSYEGKNYGRIVGINKLITGKVNLIGII